MQNIDIVDSILRSMGESSSRIEYVKDRPGHDRRYSLDDSKMRKLGWKPKNEFKDALRKTIEWYKKNQDWWKKIKHKSADYKVYYNKQYEDRS